ncbi:MAG: FeoB-associated Cys-rich membrane protein [Polaribacter sp.]|nr:FeoB-associated Cys-rich membrane protein [Polaribacter sp.]MBT7704812.1 FeoB-associated Cys-rich membrane protein [Polaribacter sp.]
MQQIIAYGILIFAVGFLVKKYFLSSKTKTNCGTDCGCS